MEALHNSDRKNSIACRVGWWETSETQVATDEGMGTIYGIEREGKKAESRSSQCRQAL